MTKHSTFRIVSLGCRTNQYEAQAYRDQLEAIGYRPAKGEEEADICVVNTCTVTAGADRDSRHEIRKLAKNNPHSRLVVTGCSAESQKQTIESIEGVTDIVLNRDKERLVDLLFPDREDLPEFSIKNFDGHTRSFVKVQDGCNSFCTYCIIPYVRGRSRSRTVEEILREVEGLIESGYKEVVLTGINIGDFDGTKSASLADLVELVDQLPGLQRLRLSSIDPDEVDDKLIDTLLKGKTTCPSLHIVLQSGSNVILKRMNRKYTRQIFLETAERLREASPDFTLTTDIIVGFPGETEEDFTDTLAVVQEVQFAKVHIFPFSPRARTRAASMPNQICSSLMRQRKQLLAREAERQAYTLRSTYVGRRMAVLLEQAEDSCYISGHTENFLTVQIPKGDLQPNEIVEVELVENSPKGLLGKLV